MFKKLLSVIFALTTLLAAGATQAQVEPASAESFLKKSGLWRQLGTIHLQVKVGFREALGQRGEKPKEAETVRMLNILDAAYEGGRLRKTALKSLTKTADPKYSPEVFAWYDSATGVAITRLEELASEDTRAPNVVEAEGTKALQQASAQRKDLIAKLIVVTRSPEAIAMMSINTTLAILQGVAQASPNSAMPALPSMRYELEKQKPSIQRMVAATLLGTFAMTYQALSDEQLGAYLSFLETLAGQHATAIGLRAFEDAMIDAANVFGQGLVGTLERSNT
jgi:hypothetical protein